MFQRLLALYSLVAFCAIPFCFADEATKTVPSNGGPDWLRGAQYKVKDNAQGAMNKSSVRMPRPSLDLNGAQNSQVGISNRAHDLSPFKLRSVVDTNIPVMTVEDSEKNSPGGGLGLLGMYALCPDDAGPCYITNVFPNSDLNQFAVESGDLLTKINGVSPFDYMHTIHPITPGDRVNLTVVHQGIPKSVSARLLDSRTLTPFFSSYAQWATSHISFMQEHRMQYHSCGLF